MAETVILVPTDFSTNANSAVEYAVRVAREGKSRLIFLHAFRLLQTNQSSGKTPMKIKEEWNLYASDNFKQLKKDYLRNVNIDYEFVTEIGFADDAIRTAAKSYNAGLVIMGSSGDGAWAGVFGSTTLSIVNNSKCPIVIVPPEITYSLPERIAFAFDFKPIKNVRQFEQSVKMLSATKKHLNIFNINKKKEANSNWKEPVFSQFEIHYHSIPDENIVSGIINYVEHNDFDLLLLLKRNHSLLEQIFSAGITNKIVAKLKLPIMVVHE